MVEQCFVRINGPNEENRNCNYQRWQYAGDLPKLNENEYQILCGTDRERSEIGNISQTIYINSAMPAEKSAFPVPHMQAYEVGHTLCKQFLGS